MPLSLTFVLTIISLSVPQLVSAACECGYSTHSINANENEVYTDALESDFLRLKDFNSQEDWERQVWETPPVGTAKWGRNYTAANVRTNPGPPAAEGGVEGSDPGLQLWVSSGVPQGGSVPSGEVATRRRDMLYGSFRAGIKYTGEHGTCGAFFWQRSDEAEIDFEFLSKLYTDPSKADLLLVIHAAPEVSRDHIFQPTTVPFRPDFGYHEYRFDWTPGRITFYTDGKLIWETEKGVPLEAGGLILNHWSNGDPGWSNGPPAQDAHMEFSYVKAYFNTTSDAEYKTRCRDRSKPDAVCKVPDQTSPPEPRKSATFVSPKKGLPEQGGPAPPPPQKVTPDATCGGSNGYTCLGSEHGDCCSSYGFCGSTKLYCSDPKCQPGFGKCEGGT